jgi:predicted N-acetyltransferase YhbS
VSLSISLPMADSFIVRPATPEDYPQAGELVAHVFSRGDIRQYERFLHHWLTTRPYEPGFNYTLHRLGILNGQIVAHIRVKPNVLIYGTARLAVGGIGEVCVHPDHRGQGYSVGVLQDAMALLAEGGAHMALLNGISNYYDRFGFSPVWPFYDLEIEAEVAAALNSPLRLRDAQPEDTPALATLYHKHWDGRVTFRRDTAVWDWRVQSGYAAMQKVVEDGYGRVCGYAAGHSLTDERIEVLTDTPEAALTLLRAGGEAHLASGKSVLHWLVPPDDALVSFARQFVPVKVSARYLPRGGWMARLIDARGLIQALLPEISAQASAAAPAVQPDSLVMDAGGLGVRIGLRGDEATFCQLTYHDFIQVLFGSLRPAALAVRPYSQLQPGSVRLLEQLFPPRMAVLGWWDWF